MDVVCCCLFDASSDVTTPVSNPYLQAPAPPVAIQPPAIAVLVAKSPSYKSLTVPLFHGCCPEANGETTSSSSEEETDDTPRYTCPICLTNPRCKHCRGQLTERFVRLPCSHKYHIACIDKWFDRNKTDCPLCRHDIGTSLSSSNISVAIVLPLENV
jgi:hypothetical protein